MSPVQCTLLAVRKFATLYVVNNDVLPIVDIFDYPFTCMSLFWDGGIFRHVCRRGTKPESLPSGLELGAIGVSGAGSVTGVVDAGELVGAGRGTSVTGAGTSVGAGTGANVPPAASQQNRGRRRRMDLRYPQP